MRGRIQSKSIDSSAAANSAPMSTFSGDEHARRLFAERVVDRRREVQPAEVAVAVVADVADVVLARHFAAERRRPLDEVVLVVVRLFVLAIAVVGERRLRREADAPESPAGTGSRRTRRRRAALCPRSFRPLFVSFSRRRKYAMLYCQRLLSRVPNRRAPSWLSWNRKPRKSDENGWMPMRKLSKS